MTDKMTLLEVRDWHRGCEQAAIADGHEMAAHGHKELADAIDTHLAGMGEQVGVTYTMEALVPGGEVRCYAALNQELPAGTKLFAAPPASGDWDKVRAVIAWLHSVEKTVANAGVAADKLTAALPENAK